MKIYTKSGDAGETGLYGGARVPKDDLRLRTYGTLDELNSVLGVVLAEEGDWVPEMAPRLLRIQGELFQLGAELATQRGKQVGIPLIDAERVNQMEQEIDTMEAELPPLKNFILPGGLKPAAFLHLARTVSRRAERELISLHRAEPLRPVILQYMNRLSDYFFVTARYTNHRFGCKDTPWEMRHS
jgi:cob(I)alamin adenosyltransferase